MNVDAQPQFNQVTKELMEKVNPDHPEEILKQLENFDVLMMRYESAIREVRTKLEILNDELALTRDSSPISSIISRRKKPASIYEKLIRQGNEITLASIEENLNDVAGVRVICAFIDDIYKVAKMLVQQDDVVLVEVKDYINNPKPNGYRSYHMIVEIPVFFSNEKCPMRVEVQIRTVAMDFWASLEHRIKYKKGLSDEVVNQITADLKGCADTIAETDRRMLAIRDRINNLEKQDIIDRMKTRQANMPDHMKMYN
jgi:putative GTP pyrophosphokinase